MAKPFDAAKRDKTLRDRGIAFDDADIVFAGLTYTVEDTRKDYGEQRFVTAGELSGRMVIVVWTWREGQRRIISMRKANEREQRKFGKRLGQRFG